MAVENQKSKILVVGGTGRIGRFIVKASVKAGHPTVMLVRASSIAADPEKATLLEVLQSDGVIIVFGDLYDHQSLVNSIKQVDVVISTIGDGSDKTLADQVKIIDAIKEAGNIKRFLPSEFGNDVGRVNFVEPAKTTLGIKARLRQIIRAEGIPHTIVCTSLFHGFFLPRLGQAKATSPPTDKVTVLGDGNSKAIFVNEQDAGTYTIKAVEDPRTLNKILYVRPRANFYSLNQLVSLWEEKIGKSLEKIHVPEEDLLKKIQESPFPLNFQLAIAHSAFVKGEQTNFEIDPSIGVEATELYPDVKYITVDEYMTYIRDLKL